ncbi:hypothetical protein I317_06577 [Kwoniella heveanensis CBS 569]|nr:hypothetical protein I317_06577 [Kwoniella heveanensis CBS 569]
MSGPSSSPLSSLTPSPRRVQVPARLHADPLLSTFNDLRQAAGSGTVDLPARAEVFKALEDFIKTRSKLFPPPDPHVVTEARAFLANLLDEARGVDRGTADQWSQVMERLDKLQQTVQQSTAELKNEISAVRNFFVWQRQEDHARLSGHAEVGFSQQTQNLSGMGFRHKWIPVPSHLSGKSQPDGISYTIEGLEHLSTLPDDHVSNFLQLYGIPVSEDNLDHNRKILGDFLAGIAVPAVLGAGAA